jgi:hypothetical protein
MQPSFHAVSHRTDVVSGHHSGTMATIGTLLLPQNEQEIKTPIKRVGVWFLPNALSLKSHI